MLRCSVGFVPKAEAVELPPDNNKLERTCTSIQHIDNGRHIYPSGRELNYQRISLHTEGFQKEPAWRIFLLCIITTIE